MKAREFVSMVEMSCRDYWHEAKLSACTVIGIAAALTPLLVLFGLKFGVISSMLQRLVEDPRARALQPIGQGKYDEPWLRALRSEPGVGFLVPNTRFLAATALLDNRQADRSLEVELLPSADGDPLLPEAMHWPATEESRPEPVVLSASAAEKLASGPGTKLDARFGRTLDGSADGVSVPLEVIAVLPLTRFERDGVLVRLPFLLAAEDYREGYAVPAFGVKGKERGDAARTFASFRLYAATIDDVANLRSRLVERGVDPLTRLADIELIERLDRDLTVLFVVVAGLGALGYVLGMMVSLWASVVRKQKELSLLRLVGFSTGAIALFPVVQALLSALLGAACASLVTLAVAPSINRLFRDELHAGERMFRLLPVHFAVAALLTVGFAILAASYGGLRAARIAPGEGLRDE